MRIFITRFDMSPYRAKFEEKTATWWRLRKSRTWKTGAPILMPRAFASFDLAMMHPSLFDRTTRGRLSRSGLKTFSQEAGGVSVTIEEIYIDPDYRSRGLATEFFDWLKAQPGIMRLRLEVEDYNEGAKRLYERMGFELLPYLQMVIDKQRQ